MSNDEQKIAAARRLAEQAGARIVSFGRGWRVVGPTIDVLVADLGSLHPADFVRSASTDWRKARGEHWRAMHGR